MSYLQLSQPHEIAQGYNIAQQYANGTIVAWPGEVIARQEFQLLSQQPNSRFISASLPVQGDGKMMLFQCTRTVLKADTKNYPQEIGDCVSFGAKNAIEYLLAIQITLGKQRQLWRSVFPPYLYGCGRVFIGKGQIPAGEDGSVGSWQAEAVMQYGAIASDEPNVPAYSGRVAKQFGGSSQALKPFVDMGKLHLVKSTTKVTSFQHLTELITNGYPVTVASNQGFNMEADSSGFHSPKGSWGHQMCIMGVDSKYKTPYATILNSWGDVHGHLKDFDTQEDLPVGVLRVRAETIERMIRQDDTFAYSHADWFEEQKLPIDLFKLL